MSGRTGARAFEPMTLGPVTLRNRFVKAATFEGMCPGGRPSAALTEHHRAIAAGGAAMTTVAYCAVSPEGRTYAHQLLMTPDVVEGLRTLARAVHDEGGAVAVQLGHSGYFSDPSVGGRPLAPARLFNLYGLSWSKAMNTSDLARVRRDFADAAALAVEAEMDAVELHLGHGYLLSQFLSPFTNRRRDAYGGPLEHRLRYPLEVVQAVRERVGERLAILAKINVSDGFRGGLTEADATEVAAALERSGAVDALVLSGGFVSKTPLYMLRGRVPLAEMLAVQPHWYQRLGLRLFGKLFVQRYPFTPGFFLGPAQRIRRAVSLPLALAGGIDSREVIERALAAGMDLLVVGRALVHDPAFVRRLERGEIERSTCDHCNACIAEMDRGGLRCVHPAH